MDGRQITGSNYLNDVSRPEPAPIESPPRPTMGFMTPDEVVTDLRLTHAEEREILASWASDVHAVPDAPALRQLENGAVVRVDDILRALKCLGDGDGFERMTFGSLRPFAGLRIRFPTRLKSALRRGWSDDDDDSPPCPATIVGPLDGPLSGGETADLGLALAA